MRPMPYTPFTPCHCDKTDEPHYAEQGGLMRYVADNAAYSKHLTDAECAAEYWRAVADEQINLSTNEDDAGAVDAHHHIRNTWYRFATHPHADEVDQ